MAVKVLPERRKPAGRRDPAFHLAVSIFIKVRDKMARVGTRELGRILGISHPRVIQLEHEGVLTKCDDGKYDVDESQDAYRAFKENSKRKTATSNPATIGDVYEQTARAKLKDVEFGAAIKEQKLLELKNTLVNRAEVIAEAERVADAFSSVLRSIAPRIAVMCEGRTAREIEALIEDEHAKAIEELKHIEI